MNRIRIIAFLGILLVFFSVAVEVKAATVVPPYPHEIRYINGNGVRLRKEGHSGGLVLELMYNNEQIKFYPDIYGIDTEYNAMIRQTTGTYGYVDHHYTRY